MLTTSWGPILRLVALVTEQIGPALAASSAAGLALLALAAGVSEEVLFRGLVQGSLLAPIVTHTLYDFVALLCVACGPRV